MRTEQTSFAIGEKKYVVIRVTGCEVFEIARADYMLRLGDEVEDSGECTIQQTDEHTVYLSALVQPRAKGATYTLEYTYEVPPEILKHMVRISVN